MVHRYAFLLVQLSWVLVMSSLSDTDLQDALKGISIPPQPQILVDIQMEQAMPDPDMRRIADLIRKDPALAGTMLKIVNSPFFGARQSITDIRQAVERLGLNLVFNILAGLSIKGALSDSSIVALTRFWDSAIDLAQACMLLAKHFKMRNPDEAYLLGLFHNCGIPLLLSKFPNYMTVLEQAYKQPNQLITEYEWNQFKSHHAVIGYYIARSWKLPAHLSNIINHHHDVQDFFANLSGTASEIAKNQQLMCILKVGEHICGIAKIFSGQAHDLEWEAIGPIVCDKLEIIADDIADLRDEILDQLN